MGENIAWLARKWYPGEKIIVWAASAHTGRKLGRIRVGSITMADVAEKLIGEKTYSIAFTAYRGSTGGLLQVIPRGLPPADPDSLEALLHAAGNEYAVLAQLPQLKE